MAEVEAEVEAEAETVNDGVCFAAWSECFVFDYQINIGRLTAVAI